jgi:hypothetical protein
VVILHSRAATTLFTYVVPSPVSSWVVWECARALGNTAHINKETR